MVLPLPPFPAPRSLESSKDGREAGMGGEAAKLDLIATSLPIRGF
jgi:hypothetical protein